MFKTLIGTRSLHQRQESLEASYQSVKSFSDADRSKFVDVYGKQLRAYDRKLRQAIHSGERSAYTTPQAQAVAGSSFVPADAEVEFLKGVNCIVHYQYSPMKIVSCKIRKYISSAGRYNPREFMETGQHRQMPVVVDGYNSFSDYPYPSNVGAAPGKCILRKAEVPRRMFLDDADYIKTNTSVGVPGTWEFTHVHLQKFLEGPAPNIDEKVLLQAAKNTLECLPHFTVEAPTKESMKWCKLNPDANPGVNTSQYYPNKALAAKFAHKAARRIWDSVNSGALPLLPSQYSCGGRMRRVSPIEHFKAPVDDIHALLDQKQYPKFEARLVQNPDFVSQMVQLPWQKVYAEQMHKAKATIDSWSWLGKSMVYSGWKALLPFTEYKTCVEGDWAGFDESAPRQVIQMAFALIRSFYARGAKSDKFFNLMVENFLNRRVVTPGDHTYYLRKGIPSGTVWTADIGTIINILLWNYIILDNKDFKKYGIKHKDVYGAFCGDDFLFGLSKTQDCPGALNSISEYVYHVFGMKLKDMRLSPMIHSEEPDYSLSILKTTLTKDWLPSIRSYEVIKRMNLPERNPDQTWDKWMATTIQVPAPGKARDVLFEMVGILSRSMGADFKMPWMEIGDCKIREPVDALKYRADTFFNKIVCGSPYQPLVLDANVTTRFDVVRFLLAKQYDLPGVTPHAIANSYCLSYVPEFFRPGSKIPAKLLRYSSYRSYDMKKIKRRLKKSASTDSNYTTPIHNAFMDLFSRT
jgi:hypothetical protein